MRVKDELRRVAVAATVLVAVAGFCRFSPGQEGGGLFITLLTSILSVMQISDAWRNIIFGVIIISMLLLQTLRRKGN